MPKLEEYFEGIPVVDLSYVEDNEKHNMTPQVYPSNTNLPTVEMIVCILVISKQRNAYIMTIWLHLYHSHRLLFHCRLKAIRL